MTHFPSGSPVLVYRKTTKKWEGPFRFIYIDGETAVVQLRRGRNIFWSTCIKPWTRSQLQNPYQEELYTSDQQDPKNQTNAAAQTTKDDVTNKITDPLFKKPAKVKVKRGSPEEKAFAQSRKDEFEGLLRDGKIKPIPESEIEGNPRIFGLRFVDELKKYGVGLRKKSSLVAQNYSDE